MHPLTVAALAALHALSHRIDLTAEETCLVAADASSLGPRVWHGSLGLLHDADAAGEGVSLHLGYDRLLLRWLGCRDEAECLERHGLTVADALAADQGDLLSAARAVEGVRDVSTSAGRAALVLLVEIWSARAGRLAGTGEDRCALGAFSRAVEIFPLPVETVRSLWSGFIGACEANDNHDLARLARVRLARVLNDDDSDDHAVRAAAVLVFSVLWAITHDAMVLESERQLDPEIERSTATWEQIRLAITECRLDAVPAPIQTVKAWCTGPGLDEDDIRACLTQYPESLPRLFETIGAVWGGDADPDSLPPTALSFILLIVRIRRVRIESDFQPLPGERRNIFYEVHQGARRRSVVERLDLMRYLNAILERCGGLEPAARMCLALDLAAETESRGEHDATRTHLEETRRAAALVDDTDRREYGDVCLAHHHWHCGEVDQATALLAGLLSERAIQLRDQMAAHEQARHALVVAVRDHRRAGDVVTWSALAHAEIAAGHSVAGERTAEAITRAHPPSPLAWTTYARVLHEHGRHRDAIAPAREVVRFSVGQTEPLALLASILSRIGDDGRDESVELAEQVIVEMVRSGSVAVLSEMAYIAARGANSDCSSLRHAHAADDLVWRLRDSEKPNCEWLGAAAARRCQLAWAPDAMTWIVRLAEVAPREPAALARWVVDRVDALQHLRSRGGRMRLGPPRSSGEEGLVSDSCSESVEGRCDISIRLQGLRAALQAARSLGYPLDQAAVELGLCAADLAALDEAPSDHRLAALGFDLPGTDWTGHLPALETAFGIGLVSRLRASEAACRALDSLDPCQEGTDSVVSLVLAVLSSEEVVWIQWAAERPDLRPLQADGSNLTADARDRLVRVIRWSTLDDLETVVLGPLLGEG